jgi:nitrite reductase/ring-hydroxylating ferredoxin subunit
MPPISKDQDHYVFATNLSNIQEAGGCLSIQIRKHTIALFYHNSKVYAMDNRCPHMGFPLSKGTVKDSILTCHWHHARFDLNNGGTFDQWAGDVQFYPVEIRNKYEVWVDACSMASRGGQMFEGAYRQYSLLDKDGSNAARVNILAASRYLAAHSPTMRSQDRTYQIANQLHKGEQLFEAMTPKNI